jgi:hypothetical protein
MSRRTPSDWEILKLHCIGGERIEVEEVIEVDLPSTVARQFLWKIKAGLLVPWANSNGDVVHFLPPERARQLIDDERELRQRIASGNQRESEGVQALLGSDCPPLQRQLFDVVCDGNLFWINAAGRKPLPFGAVTAYLEYLAPLHEEDVIEILYQVEWDSLKPRDRIRLRARLRRLQSDFNNRLLKRKVPLRVVRPADGWLFLWHTADARALAEAKNLVADARPSAEAKDQMVPRAMGARRLAGGSEGRDRPRAVPPTVEECLTLIRKYLAKGPRGSKALDDHCASKGCRPGTIRRARKKLGVEVYHEGFGAAGRWLARLPPGSANSQSRPSAHL